MRKVNRTKTTFICTVDGKRVYRHDMPHGMIKYSVRLGKKGLQNKVSFGSLDILIQEMVAKEWHKLRLCNVA